MVTKIKELYTKYREVFWYVITGGITTLVDLATFTLAYNVMGIHYQIAKIMAWFLAVICAFIGNKLLVFRTRTDSAKALLSETTKFFGARVLTLVFALAFMYVAVDLLGVEENLSNLLCTVAVFVLNYVLSKLLVFTKKEEATE